LSLRLKTVVLARSASARARTAWSASQITQEGRAEFYGIGLREPKAYTRIQAAGCMTFTASDGHADLRRG
jgi:hypothetical protein